MNQGSNFFSILFIVAKVLAGLVLAFSLLHKRAKGKTESKAKFGRLFCALLYIFPTILLSIMVWWRRVTRRLAKRRRFRRIWNTGFAITRRKIRNPHFHFLYETDLAIIAGASLLLTIFAEHEQSKAHEEKARKTTETQIATINTNIVLTMASLQAASNALARLDLQIEYGQQTLTNLGKNIDLTQRSLTNITRLVTRIEDVKFTATFEFTAIGFAVESIGTGYSNSFAFAASGPSVGPYSQNVVGYFNCPSAVSKTNGITFFPDHFEGEGTNLCVSLTLENLDDLRFRSNNLVSMNLIEINTNNFLLGDGEIYVLGQQLFDCLSNPNFSAILRKCKGPGGDDFVVNFTNCQITKIEYFLRKNSFQVTVTTPAVTSGWWHDSQIQSIMDLGQATVELNLKTYPHLLGTIFGRPYVRLVQLDTEFNAIPIVAEAKYSTEFVLIAQSPSGSTYGPPNPLSAQLPPGEKFLPSILPY